MPRFLSRDGALTLAGLIVLCAAPAAGQTARPMTLYQSTYQLHPGEALPISAAPETVDFLKSAATRKLTTQGSSADGLVVSPSRDGTGAVLGAALRTKPGAYTVQLSATDAAGEQREASLNVVVDALPTVPAAASRPPVVLLNGWLTGLTNACPVAASSSETFGNLAQYLVSDGAPVVYLFDNCLEGANQTVETLAADLATFLTSITYDNGTPVTQFDLVAHSMGGLIVRAYLAGLQPNQSLTPPANTLVRNLVMIAVPNFGSFVAGNYSSIIAAGTQSGELIPGSSLLWNLATWNQRQDDLRGVNAIAVIGNAGTWNAGLNSNVALTNASDGIVSLTSASLSFVLQGSAITRIVPYCHVDPSAFTNTNFGAFACNAAGIANVTSTSHQTGQIVRSFLSGTADWKSIGGTPSTDPYLSKDGGLYFALVGQQNQYLSDLTQVTWGTVPLLNGGDTGTVFYSDFISGTGVLQPTSTSLRTLNCGSLTEPAGYYSAARCKVDTAIFSIGPLVSGTARIVNSGANITLAGARFGNSQCSGCQVQATAAGATTSTTLQVSAWSDTSITAALPASFSGLVTISVTAPLGIDAISIMTLSPTAISVSSSTLQFSYTSGGSTPAAQSLAISTSGLNWTSAVSTTDGAAWLAVSPTSGTAPSTLQISVSPANLAAGTYTGTIQISASGSTTATVTVTLTVAGGQAVLAVSPAALSFAYTYGGDSPPVQTVSIANTGSGVLSWTATDPDFWIGLSPTSGSSAGNLSISVNPANLAAGTYTSNVTVTAAGATGSPSTIAITLVVNGTQPAGTISAVANTANYQPGFASATWLAIFGNNLSQTTATWQASDFVNGALPTSLHGVSVAIDGVPAYVEYISPTQINVLAPDDATLGPVNVQVTTAQQPSNMVSASKQQFAPAFFTLGNTYVSAVHADGTLVGKPGLLGAGVTTEPAAPGEIIELYGTGFGPTNPATPTGALVTTAATLANTVQISIGGMTANAAFAGLVGPGLYQFNVTVPQLASGDAAVTASIGGVTTQSGLALSVQ